MCIASGHMSRFPRTAQVRKKIDCLFSTKIMKGKLPDLSSVPVILVMDFWGTFGGAFGGAFGGTFGRMSPFNSEQLRLNMFFDE